MEAKERMRQEDSNSRNPFSPRTQKHIHLKEKESEKQYTNESDAINKKINKPPIQRTIHFPRLYQTERKQNTKQRLKRE